MSGNTNNIRIGIDVGGTFTHAVALDGGTLDLLGKSKVPTTHIASEGVAKGIIESLILLLEQTQIAPDDVSFIAHSTTQATNALLEGDVSPVGVIGMGSGANAWFAQAATTIKKIELAPGKFLHVYHKFLNTSHEITDDQIKSAIADLQKQGAKVIVASEAFSVDCPENETRVIDIARSLKIPATSGSEVSQLYGLKVRTITAIINASMLPKMMESADMTEKSVRQSGINAPIMIMRSDGGVMDIATMRKRPIYTLLSGPAAGVAAAMMYLHISDGIFLEVGGTSTDISAIRNGRALIKAAEVGGHKIYMHTLDVRTIGVAGGSMPRLRGNKIIDVGPRSAHIAGLGYVSFQNNIKDIALHLIKPLPSDPSDYLALSEGTRNPSLAVTTTCAANLLGLVADGDCAKGNTAAIQNTFEALSKRTGTSPESTANTILSLASQKCIPIVHQLLKDYKLDPDFVTLVGGGGGAAAIVPYASKEINLPYKLAENADVISAIGVALALVRETIERQIIQPSNDDILRVRQEAYNAVQKMGADPNTIEVHVEVDSKINIVRASASGSTPMSTEKKTTRHLDLTELKSIAAVSMKVDESKVIDAAGTDQLKIFSAETTESKLCGLLTHKVDSLRVLDTTGVVRLQIKNGAAKITSPAEFDNLINSVAEEYSSYGDAGRVLPNMVLLAGSKIIDFSGLFDLSQMIALGKIELEFIPRDASIALLADLS